MRWTVIATVTIAMLHTTACTKTIYIPTEQRRTEVITLRDTVIEHFTAGESHSNHTSDTVSILQGNGATSTAIIDKGILSHTLTIHPRHDSIALQVREVHIIDSVAYALTPSEKHTHCAPTHNCATAIAFMSFALAIILIYKCLQRA